MSLRDLHYGQADGTLASRDATAAMDRVLARLPVYISADIKDGHRDDPDEVSAYVAGLGAAGVNIEDGTAEALESPPCDLAGRGAAGRSVRKPGASSESTA